MDFFHKAVLLQEAVDGLNVLAGKRYVDATGGGGGHAEEIVKRGGIVLVIDQDPDAIVYLEKKFEHEKRITIAQGNFGDISEIAKANGFDPERTEIRGTLFDLGLSSYQIDSSKRGFSFRRDEELDMRMDKKRELKAFDIINYWTRDGLIDLFTRIGEEHFSKIIVDAILEERSKRDIKTALELSEIIKKAVPVAKSPIHPATRVFQALRIAVNEELDNLKKGISSAFEILKSEGRICVISFHSLEDRIVKLSFLDFEKNGYARVITKKPIYPSLFEIENNRRARSAKLRIIEKL